MFDQRSIPQLVKLLRHRGAYLYHACQLQDFESYLRLGGIPSRQMLEASGLPFTGFASDSSDREYRVWDKVFLNMDDIGDGFAQGHRSTPNVYGPILLQIPPTALLSVTDVAICLRSASAPGFDRTRESLQSISEVKRLFLNSYGSQVKFPKLLREEFRVAYAGAPEVSCTCSKGILEFTSSITVIVDPYMVPIDAVTRRRLTDYVMDAMQRAQLDLNVQTRQLCQDDKTSRYQELWNKSRQPEQRQEIVHPDFYTPELRQWAQQINTNSGVRKNYFRFLRYLFEGTVKVIESRVEQDQQDRRNRRKRMPPRVAPECQWDIYEAYDRDAIEAYVDPDDESDQIRRDLDNDAEQWARAHEDGWPDP